MFDFIKQNPFLWLIIFLLIVSPSFLFGAFQVVAIIIFVIMILAIIGLLLLRWKIFKLQKEMNPNGSGSTANGGDRFRSSQSSRRSADDIDVKIYSSQGEKKVSDDVGDYVDFEEIKVDNENK